MKKSTVVLVSLCFLGLFGYLILNSLKEEPEKQESVSPTITSDTAPTKVLAEGRAKLEKPKMQIEKNKKYSAVLSTAKGKIVLELFADKTPVAVNNFIYLARNNFYDKTIFHRSGL